MAEIRKIGNKVEILNARQERTNWETLIDDIAEKNEDELATWFNNHFSGLSADIRSGMELIVKTIWANAKLTRKICQKIKA